MEPVVDLVDRSLVAKLSIPYLLRHEALPLAIVADTLIAVFADPLDEELVSVFEMMFGVETRRCGATSDRIAEVLTHLQQGGESADQVEGSGSAQIAQLQAIGAGYPGDLTGAQRPSVSIAATISADSAASVDT